MPWARCAWGALLLLHCWPLAAVLARLASGEGGLGALTALLATQALFAAKCADVRWLRLPSRKGAIVAFVLATCLAHPEAITELGGAPLDTAAAASLALAPAVALTHPKRALARWLRSTQRAAFGLRLDALLHGLARRAVLAPSEPVHAFEHLGRAPPASILR